MPSTRKRTPAGTPQLRQQVEKLARDHPELLQAYGHPVRVGILALFDAGARELSPTEIARALDEPTTNVAYHVRILVKLGIITPTRTSPTRATVTHHYRLST